MLAGAHGKGKGGSTILHSDISALAMAECYHDAFLLSINKVNKIYHIPMQYFDS